MRRPAWALKLQDFKSDPKNPQNGTVFYEAEGEALTTEP